MNAYIRIRLPATLTGIFIFLFVSLVSLKYFLIGLFCSLFQPTPALHNRLFIYLFIFFPIFFYCGCPLVCLSSHSKALIFWDLPPYHFLFKFLFIIWPFLYASFVSLLDYLSIFCRHFCNSSFCDMEITVYLKLNWIEL